MELNGRFGRVYRMSLAPSIQTPHEKIYLIRDKRVMLDRDLAAIYGVRTKQLNQAVRRNFRRFRPDFMFRLSTREASNLRSQFVTSSSGWGGRRYRPFAFTEHGAVMLSVVLNTRSAVEMSVVIVKVFNAVKDLALVHKDLADKLLELERRVSTHDHDIRELIETIRELAFPAEGPKRKIGFKL